MSDWVEICPHCKAENHGRCVLRWSLEPCACEHCRKDREDRLQDLLANLGNEADNDKGERD